MLSTLATCVFVCARAPTRNVCVVGSVGQGTPFRRPVFTGNYSLPEHAEPGVRYGEAVCPLGHYCESGLRKACPAGQYGNVTALTTRSCSGPCLAGHYCTLASLSATQNPCGWVGVYCPLGSQQPVPAAPGELTVGGTEATRSGVSRCPSSQYCVNGTAFNCSAGRFGCATGLGSPDCNGPCAAGFFCPPGSDSNRRYACGNASVYCPEGSGIPVLVSLGNYSLGGPQPDQHTMEAACPAGSYCLGGVKVQAH